MTLSTKSASVRHVPEFRACPRIFRRPYAVPVAHVFVRDDMVGFEAAWLAAPYALERVAGEYGLAPSDVLRKLHDALAEATFSVFAFENRRRLPTDAGPGALEIAVSVLLDLPRLSFNRFSAVLTRGFDGLNPFVMKRSGALRELTS